MVLFLLSGCFRREESLRVIVPNGYRGMIQLETTPEAAPAPRVEGVIELRIPSSGVLALPDLSPITTWHHTDARWADGSVLPATDGPPGHSADTRLHAIGADDRGHAWLLVGTDDEARRALGLIGRSPVPLGQ